MEIAPLSHGGPCLYGMTEAPRAGEDEDPLAEVLPFWGPVVPLSAGGGFCVAGEAGTACS